MEKQIKLIRLNDEDEIEGIKPEVKINRNVSISATAKIIEIMIRKTYVIPHR